MTDLAYMVREDWAQDGTAMAPSSVRIRDWLRGGPVLFAVTDERKFRASDRSADFEAAEYIDPGSAKNRITNIRNLTRLAGRDDAANAPVVVLHPFERRDCEALREALGAGAFGRVFVLRWSMSSTTV